MKDRTGAAQWDFPTEEDKEEDLKGSEGTQTSSQGDTKTSSASATGVTGQSVVDTGCSYLMYSVIISQQNIIF